MLPSESRDKVINLRGGDLSSGKLCFFASSRFPLVFHPQPVEEKIRGCLCNGPVFFVWQQWLSPLCGLVLLSPGHYTVQELSLVAMFNARLRDGGFLGRATAYDLPGRRSGSPRGIDSSARELSCGYLPQERLPLEGYGTLFLLFQADDSGDNPISPPVSERWSFLVERLKGPRESPDKGSACRDVRSCRLPPRRGADSARKHCLLHCLSLLLCKAAPQQGG